MDITDDAQYGARVTEQFRAQVACLEAAIVAKDAALEHFAAERHRWGGHGETERLPWQQCSNQECRLAQAALSPDAGKDTLCCLKDCGQPAVIGQNFDWHDEGGVLPLCERHVKDRIDRRGWLPPEVREQAAAALEDAVNTAHSSFLDRHAYPRTQHSGSLRECPTDLCKKWRAALDALRGVE